jgi:radical SAM protein (TIGR01212 family)
LAKGFLIERYGSTLFSLYFQAYSSTWADVETLRSTYDEALAEGPFVDFTIGTRPDCVPDPVVELLASYRSSSRDVWVELGLQSSRDETLSRIGRGHDVRAFIDAAARLRKWGLPFTTHILFGLPGEGKAEFLDTVRLAVAEGTSGVKFHDLLLLPGTRLHEEWKQGLLSPVDPEAYLDAVASALADLPPKIVVWRVCSDTEDRKSARPPGKKWPKNRFLQRLKDEVEKRKTAEPLSKRSKDRLWQATNEAKTAT